MSSHQQRQINLQTPKIHMGLMIFIMTQYYMVLIFRSADIYCFPYLYASSILVVSRKSPEAKSISRIFQLSQSPITSEFP